MEELSRGALPHRVATPNRDVPRRHTVPSALTVPCIVCGMHTFGATLNLKSKSVAVIGSTSPSDWCVP
jgi:hypothetical protein